MSALLCQTPSSQFVILSEAKDLLFAAIMRTHDDEAAADKLLLDRSSKLCFLKPRPNHLACVLGQRKLHNFFLREPARLIGIACRL